MPFFILIPANVFSEIILGSVCGFFAYKLWLTRKNPALRDNPLFVNFMGVWGSIAGHCLLVVAAWILAVFLNLGTVAVWSFTVSLFLLYFSFAYAARASVVLWSPHQTGDWIFRLGVLAAILLTGTYIFSGPSLAVVHATPGISLVDAGLGKLFITGVPLFHLATLTYVFGGLAFIPLAVYFFRQAVRHSEIRVRALLNGVGIAILLGGLSPLIIGEFISAALTTLLLLSLSIGCGLILLGTIYAKPQPSAAY